MAAGHYCLGLHKQTLRLRGIEKTRPETSNRFYGFATMAAR